VKARQPPALARFGTFANLVLTLEAEVATPPSGGPPAGPSGSSDAGEAAFDKVRLALAPFVEPPASGGGRNDAAARYLMAAFADDVFLNLAWAGQADWRTVPLEQQYFGTEDGGTVVLQRIEALLAAPDPDALGMARAYLATLALGFEGDLRGTADAAAKLADLRHRLWSFVEAGDPAELDSAGHLFPEAYRHTLDGGKPQRLPLLWGWALGVAAVLLVWWGLSIGPWHAASAPLEAVLGRILAWGSIHAPVG
jgi:type IV/VI secretion system ImpK/VasF family protein